MKELSYHAEIFVADQFTKRHKKNSQPTCLDVFDKKLHTLLIRVGEVASNRLYSCGERTVYGASTAGAPHWLVLANSLSEREGEVRTIL